VLASNNVGELVDLEGLGRCNGLISLVVLENPVVRKEVCSFCV
jgi:hypothetical protein